MGRLDVGIELFIVSTLLKVLIVVSNDVILVRLYRKSWITKVGGSKRSFRTVSTALVGAFLTYLVVEKTNRSSAASKTFLFTWVFHFSNGAMTEMSSRGGLSQLMAGQSFFVYGVLRWVVAYRSSVVISWDMLAGGGGFGSRRWLTVRCVGFTAFALDFIRLSTSIEPDAIHCQTLVGRSKFCISRYMFQYVGPVRCNISVGNIH